MSAIIIKDNFHTLIADFAYYHNTTAKQLLLAWYGLPSAIHLYQTGGDCLECLCMIADCLCLQGKKAGRILGEIWRRCEIDENLINVLHETLIENKNPKMLKLIYREIVRMRED